MRGRTLFIASVLAAALVGVATVAAGQTAPAPAPPAAGEPDRVTILFTSDQRGALVERGCGPAGEGSAPHLGRIAAALRAERARAARDGEAPPVLLDAGDALFPSPMMSDLVTVPSTARDVVAALRSAGYDALATGNTTLGAPRLAVVGLLGAAREAGLPMVATNLVCAGASGGGEAPVADGAPAERCAGSVADLTDRVALVERDGLRLGVLSVLPENLASHLARANTEGAAFTPPAVAAAAAVAGLRARGADLVVLLSHVDHRVDAPRATLDLIRALEPAMRPDVVVTASTAGLAIRIDTSADGPTIVSVGGEGLGRVRLERSGEGWAVVHADEVDTTGLADDVLDRVLAGLRAGWCERQGRRVPGGALTATMSEDDFVHLALRVMREQTRADVALVNRTAVADRRLFPLDGPLTEGHLRRTLPFENGLRVASIRGSDIESVARRVLDAPTAAVVGIEDVDGEIRINGRAVDPDIRYRLVTIDFIADGGDDILDPEALEFEPARPDARGNTGLVDRISAWLGSRRGRGSYAPAERVDLYQRPLWTAVAQLDVAVADLQVADPTAGLEEGAYDQPQLARQELFDIRLEAALRAGVSTRDHRWENRLELRFGFQRLQDAEDASLYEWSDSVDLLHFRSTYLYDAIRNRYLDGAWYGPSLFLEYDLESELWPEAEATHFVEMTGAGGLRLKPLGWLEIDVGAAVRARVPGDGAGAGLVVRAEVARRRLFSRSSVPLYVAALLDYVVLFPAQGPTHKLVAEARLEMRLWGPLSATGSVRLFLYDEAWAEPGIAVDTTFGLGVNLASRTQRF
jgi:5'-nucleotidase